MLKGKGLSGKRDEEEEEEKERSARTSSFLLLLRFLERELTKARTNLLGLEGVLRDRKRAF